MRDGDWAFVFGVLGFETARRDGEGEMCGGGGGGPTSGGGIVGSLWNFGMWGRARGMDMGCGEEGARRAGLGSGITIYALRN